MSPKQLNKLSSHLIPGHVTSEANEAHLNDIRQCPDKQSENFEKWFVRIFKEADVEHSKDLSRKKREIMSELKNHWASINEV